MRLALRLAEKAASRDEVPVGAVVVCDGRVVGRGHNRVEAKHSALEHAEITALRQAAQKLGRWRLTGCTLYATLEPCAMCAGAMVLSRIDRLVFAADDPKAGACGSVSDIVAGKRLNHRIRAERGLLRDEAARLLKDFFRNKRA
ncbi:MAG TPA: tRNA adenosine(34) deaminase TadA [Candidatus Edwardsbacteria bacterium]|nr:tRNA adenosine(34) deaminase TadA [Candidatus Edwardsbacteria bacterium]